MVSLAPGSMAFSPEPIPNMGTTFLYEEKWGDLATLNSQFADGSYQLSITGASSTVYQATLSLTGGVYPSVAPKVTNTSWITGVLFIDPLSTFNLTWTAFTGSTASDKISIFITDSANNVFPLILLPNTATSQSFGPQFFPSNKFFGLTVTFLKTAATDTTDISGSTGYAAYTMSDSINIAAAQLQTTAVTKTMSGGSIFLQTTSAGLPLITYTAKSVIDLTQPFTAIGTATPDANGIIQYNPPGTTDTRRFYRLTYP